MRNICTLWTLFC